MTTAQLTAQLISELEKPRKNYPQGVLTWEENDVAIYEGKSYPVLDVSQDKTKLSIRLPDAAARIVNPSKCTHSPDDPRLLGRVINGLIPIYGGYQIREHEGGAHISIWDRTPDNPPGNWITESGGLLIEAALKALLAKVEGEKK